MNRFVRILTDAPAPLVDRMLRPERQPVIPMLRGSRFVGRAACTYCGTDGQGVEYQGELMSGEKIHTLAAHSPGMRRVERGQLRCLGSGGRVTLGERPVAP